MDLKEVSLSTAYKSPYMQKLRQEFRGGAKPETCGRCWNEEAAGRTSKRMHSLVKFKDKLNSIDWNNDTPDQLWFVDLKLGNICNLRCRICGSWSSSRWAQEDIGYEAEPNKKRTRSYNVLKAGAWPENNPEFWQDLENLLPGVQYIEFTGGEPFMVMRHYDLLKKAVDMGVAGNIRLHYNTNATLFPELEDIWSKFKEVEIAFSIDNVGPRFEYERTGAFWHKVEENIARFRDMASRCSNIRLQSCTTINIQNAYYLPETVAWLDQQDFQFVYLNMLHDPSHMCVSTMTPAAKELVLAKLDLNAFLPKHQKEVEAIKRFIEQGAGSDGKAFREYMNSIDERREENFQALYPEMANAMGYES
jgi:MoaA/NifB/PqqE/SkfB family radical SAM enzyme